MSYEPCKNPSCASFGTPHPNCECYAPGGEVLNFAEGGQTPPLMFDDLVDDSQAAPAQDTNSGPSKPPIMFDDLVDDSDKAKTYGTPGQQALTGLESTAQGFAGPLATGAEWALSKAGIPGVSLEDQAARQAANPVTAALGQTAGLTGGLLTGYSEIGLASKIANKVLPTSIPYLGKLGALAAKAFLTNASVGAGNEVSKELLDPSHPITAAMMGNGDPTHAVAGALASTGLTGLLGSLFEGGSSALAATEGKVGSKIASYFGGLGAKASGADPLASQQNLDLLSKGLYDEKAFNKGYESLNAMSNLAKEGIANAAALVPSSYIAKNYNYSAGASLHGILKKAISSSLDKPVDSVSNLAVPAVTKWATQGMGSKILPLLDYATKVDRGNKLLNAGVNAVFKEGYKQIASPVSHAAINDWINRGGIDDDLQNELYNTQDQTPQNFAEGGSVKSKDPSPGLQENSAVSQVYPEQNILLQAAKGRMSNYLKQLKPQPDQGKLAFDSQPDMREKQRSYDRAVDIAARPMSILDKVKQGTIEPEHVQHFQSLYPELNNVLQQKLTQKITEMQSKGDKPNFQTRQGLSLLMGSPLSGELMPQNIQAIQSVFQGQKAQNAQNAAPAGGKVKHSENALTKSDQSFLTGNQSLIGRQQRQS